MFKNAFYYNMYIVHTVFFFTLLSKYFTDEIDAWKLI